MPRNYKQFYAICNTHGFDKAEVVANFTNGRTESLSALSDGQYKELMLRLLKLNEPTRQNFTPPPGNSQRRKIIAIARDMRWDTLGQKCMMQRIDEFCLHKTKYKKKLMELTQAELNKVIYIFEHEVKGNYLKRI